MIKKAAGLTDLQANFGTKTVASVKQKEDTGVWEKWKKSYYGKHLRTIPYIMCFMVWQVLPQTAGCRHELYSPA